MSKYIRHNICYSDENKDMILEVKEYGVDLGKCPGCGLDAVIVEYSGIGWVGCPLSHMIVRSGQHPSQGYSGKICRRKSKAVERWMHQIRPLANNQSNMIAEAMEGFGGTGE